MDNRSRGNERKRAGGNDHQTLSSASSAMTTTVPDIKLHKPAITRCHHNHFAPAALARAAAQGIAHDQVRRREIRSGTAARRPTIGPASSMRKFGRCSATRRQTLAHKPRDASGHRRAQIKI
jgi:hypothetical protein